jgi:DNA-binding CsgD family transcriptional regulator
MHGRAAERMVIRDLLLRTARGTGGVVLVDGEPGIGKSALLRSAAEEAAKRGVAVSVSPATAGPALVCLDDADVLDRTTLAAIRAGGPVGWVLARSNTRGRGADAEFHRLEREGAIRLTLDPLDRDDVTAMLTEAFDAPPCPDLSDLASGAAGNPELIIELITGLRDEGPATALPRRMHELARRRLDVLSRRAGHLLQTMAVLGPRFRLEDAAGLLGQTPAASLAPVREATDAGMLSATDDAFIFRHELLRRAIGELVPVPARMALHHQYGEFLLARGEAPARAAHHLIRGAHPASAASLAALDTMAAGAVGAAPGAAADAAVRALELTDPGTQVALDRAVAAAETLAAAGRLAEADRIAVGLLAAPLPARAEHRLRCALSVVRCAAGQPRDAGEQAQAVLTSTDTGSREPALAARLQALTALRDKLAGPVADSVLAGRHGTAVTVAAMVARAVVEWDDGQVGDALDLLRDAVRRAPVVSADARSAQPLLVLAAALFDLRQLAEAGTILDAADQPALREGPAGSALLVLRARAHLAAGRLPDAAACGQAALTSATAAGARGYAATAASVLAVIELRRGDITAAVSHLAGHPPDGPQFSDLYARPETLLARAQLTEVRDGPAATLDQLRRLRADARPPTLLGDPVLAAWLARTALAAGEDDLAGRVACAAATLADTNPGFPALDAAAAHSRGLVRRDAGRLAQAAAQHTDPWARASAAEDLAVLHRDEGDRQLAIDHLKEALAGYRRTGAGRDEARVRHRLRRLGIRRSRWVAPAAGTATGWGSLTETERAVARLVAEGLSNAQVAGRMYLSTHTVAHHLRHAYRKLEIAGRVELARVVMEHVKDTGLR